MSQQINYLVLVALARWLHGEWAGGRCIGAFTQAKDELVLLAKGRHAGARAVFLRIGCGGGLQYAVPVRDFRRAGQNSRDLFPDIAGRDIRSVTTVPGDRTLCIELDNACQLVLALHGNRSNVLLVDAEGRVLERFRKHLRDAPPDLLGTPPADPAGFATLDDAAHAWRFLDKALRQQLAHAVAQGFALPEAAQRLWQAGTHGPWAVCAAPDAAPQFRIVLAVDGLPAGCTAYGDLPEALEAWLRRHLAGAAFGQMRAALVGQLQAALRRWQGRQVSLRHTLARMAEERSAEELGHLLLAQLHRVQPQADAVELEDYYRDGAALQLELDPQLSPQQNAERLYTRHHDHQRRLQSAQAHLDEAQRQAERLEALFAELAAARHPGQLRELQRRAEPLLRQAMPAAHAAEQPYHEFHFQGWTIWVGRGADRNDRLTFGHAKKNDLWLHARDVPGAHVVVRARSGHAFPRPVVEYAAGLALHFSKNRNASLAPVSVTPRKYVRKHKKLAAGQVVLDREDVVMVPPVAAPFGSGA